MTVTAGPGELPAQLRPQPLEVACGTVVNERPQANGLPESESASPRRAMEEAVLSALLTPPCLVSFSGGRDSSVVLATAAHVARREGLELPVPVTHRFPAAASDETAWQEQVVGHLELPDWSRLAMTTELDVVGPVAEAVLRRHGVLFPFNAHFHVPLFERARGGSFLTGVGGDELWGPQAWRRTQLLLSGRVWPRPHHLRSIALLVSPRAVRRGAVYRLDRVRWPWLHRDVSEELRRRRAAGHASTPVSWARGIEWWWRSRNRVVVARTLELLAHDAGTRLVQPFHDPAVVTATGRHFGFGGPANRTAAMRTLFGDLLPDAVLARRSKSSFSEAFFSDHSRAFVGAWAGGGIDRALVDVDRLRAIWHSPDPDVRTLLLLQAAWLAERGRDNERRLHDTGHTVDPG